MNHSSALRQVAHSAVGWAVSATCRISRIQRDRVFLVSKVETNLVTGDGVARACEASLARLGADYLDLYLLH